MIVGSVTKKGENIMRLSNHLNYKQVLIYSLFIIFLLIGCAGVRYETTDQVAQATKVIKDPYTNTTWVNSPPVNCGDSIGDKCYFRTAFINEKFAFYQLVLKIMNKGWLFLDTAYDIQGNRLDLKVLDRKVLSGGVVREVVGIKLADPYMAQAVVNGMNIKVIGKRGQIIVKLSGGYVFGYLQKVGTYMKEAGMLPEGYESAITENMAKQQKELADKVKGRGKIGINIAFKQILAVNPGSPAEMAGLQVGDIILAADGQELNGDTAHDVMLITGEPGSKVKFLILRGEERRTVLVIRGNP